MVLLMAVVEIDEGRFECGAQVYVGERRTTLMARSEEE